MSAIEIAPEQRLAIRAEYNGQVYCAVCGEDINGSFAVNEKDEPVHRFCADGGLVRVEK